MLDVRKENDEVFYTNTSISSIGKEDIDWLKAKALETADVRCRLCVHEGAADDSTHEMIIVHAQNTYVRPHKHISKCESFHVIEGAVDVVLFDESGQITQVIELGDYASGKKFFYRISDATYHTLIIKSEIIVFHEATNGPFNREDTIFADWSPKKQELEAAEEYMQALIQHVEGFKELV